MRSAIQGVLEAEAADLVAEDRRRLAVGDLLLRAVDLGAPWPIAAEGVMVTRDVRARPVMLVRVGDLPG